MTHSLRKMVSVLWLDTVVPCENPWMYLEEAEELRPDTVTTAGFVIADTKDYITIAVSDGNECVGGVWCIPKVCVLKVTPLKPTKKIS